MTSTIEHLVSVDGTDVRFVCAEGDTLLRAALRAGVGLGYECNSGSCGSCRYQLLSGTVHDRRPEAPGLSARDRRRERRLACQSEPTAPCTIRVGGLAGPVVHRPVRCTAELRAVQPLTRDMSEFVFVADHPARFRPGQYAMIKIPGVPQERAYSMSNLGNPYGEWRFVIKRVAGGAGTTVLFDELSPGARVVIDAPYGHAYLRDDDRQIVCVAGGSGLGAMVSVVNGLAAMPDAGQRTARVFYGGRTPIDICRPAAFDLAATRLGALHFHPVVSEPQTATGGPWRPGFVHEAVGEVLGSTLTEFSYYAAGPPAMTDALARLLVLTGGLDADRLHYDRFL
ncbi:2Fe-2S iron-sulfur cluster-binding protein [Pseudonocardia sp. H11422]|uniref:2Fe-2S iron-sulfur cluster-binding protein n=1 Tax=Pseudonocardia sp. H11422 TaxID=2835866 RepID=UPI001BDC4B48|nr:2Fe-2S iron-sulfur cluster-binding protein [Pseudonocardia sp. H11422]